MADEVAAELQKRIERLPDVTTRPMFGYNCYLVKGKFFVGFSKKDRNKIIIRLSKDLQRKALSSTELKMKPFSHGAKMGWVELVGTSNAPIEIIFAWLQKGYHNAKKLSQQKDA